MDWEPRVGMRVVCVDADKSKVLEHGRVYTVSEVLGGSFYAYLYGTVEPIGICLGEASPAEDASGFTTRRFRPLDERRLDIFREALTKAPTPEKEPV